MNTDTSSANEHFRIEMSGQRRAPVYRLMARTAEHRAWTATRVPKEQWLGILNRDGGKTCVREGLRRSLAQKWRAEEARCGETSRNAPRTKRARPWTPDAHPQDVTHSFMPDAV